MKKRIFIVALFACLAVTGFSQKKTYWTSGLEMIFSWADIDDNGNSDGSIIRWAPVFNIQGMFNYDMSERVGLFTGLAVRNVGYIYNNYTFLEDGNTVTVKKKFRTYNLGIPIALKIGNMNKGFLYAGYEFELPFHYKEKTFRDEKKDKFTVWFTDRVEKVQHSFMVGYTFTRGTSLKFKYYFTEFHNQDYTESNQTQPYKGLNSHVWYISLNFGLFRDAKFHYSEDTSKEYF